MPAASRLSAGSATGRSGRSARTVVPPPGGLVSVRLPPAAARRSASPRRPEPGGQVGAASAVIGDRDDKAAVLFGDRDPSLGRRRVAGDIRQRLGDDEVGRCLDLRVVSLIVDVDRDRERRPLGECIDGGAPGRSR